MATPTDRSVGLGELASRAQTGAPARARSRSDCRNPECSNGLTPGLVAAGGGSKAQPLFGAGGVGAKRLMRWAWISCLACNAPDDARKAGATYKHLNLTQAQIAQRAQMASLKSAYQPQERATLSRAIPTAPSADAGRLAELAKSNEALSARLDEMLKQNAEMMKNNSEMSQTLSRMAMQVGALLEDNAKLRAAQLPSVNVIPGASGNMPT